MLVISSTTNTILWSLLCLEFIHGATKVFLCRPTRVRPHSKLRSVRDTFHSSISFGIYTIHFLAPSLEAHFTFVSLQRKGVLFRLSFNNTGCASFTTSSEIAENYICAASHVFVILNTSSVPRFCYHSA
jgi:hypothetical protein